MPRILTTRIAILGLGLIGGSIAKALHHNHPEIRITAYDPNKKALAQAYADGVVHVCADNSRAAMQDADVVLFAMPISEFSPTLTTLVDAITPNMLLMDVISVKQKVVDTIAMILGDRAQQFIPAHPMCGSELSSYTAAKTDLFEDKTIILTPITPIETPYLQRAKSFWHDLGAIVKLLSAQEHDEMICAVSHLPHALAFTFMNTLLQQFSPQQLDAYSGSGFKDFTRIAHSSPALWAEICLANRVVLQQQLQQFIDHSQTLQRLLQDDDRQHLVDFFTRASDL